MCSICNTPCCILHASYSTLYTICHILCTLYTVCSIFNTLFPVHYIMHYILHTMFYILDYIQHTLYSNSILFGPYSVLYTLNSTLYIVLYYAALHYTALHDTTLHYAILLHTLRCHDSTLASRMIVRSHPELQGRSAEEYIQSIPLDMGLPLSSLRMCIDADIDLHAYRKLSI